MKTKIQLLVIVALLSGCASNPASKEAAQKEEEAAATPAVPKTTSDINLNGSQQKTAESR